MKKSTSLNALVLSLLVTSFPLGKVLAGGGGSDDEEIVGRTTPSSSKAAFPLPGDEALGRGQSSSHFSISGASTSQSSKVKDSPVQAEDDRDYLSLRLTLQSLQQHLKDYDFVFSQSASSVSSSASGMSSEPWETSSDTSSSFGGLTSSSSSSRAMKGKGIEDFSSSLSSFTLSSRSSPTTVVRDSKDISEDSSLAPFYASTRKDASENEFVTVASSFGSFRPNPEDQLKVLQRIIEAQAEEIRQLSANLAENESESTPPHVRSEQQKAKSTLQEIERRFRVESRRLEKQTSEQLKRLEKNVRNESSKLAEQLKTNVPKETKRLGKQIRNLFK